MQKPIAIPSGLAVFQIVCGLGHFLQLFGVLVGVFSVSGALLGKLDFQR